MDVLLKSRGEDHYKTGGVEPVNLYEAGDMLRDFALASIIKYAFRCRRAANRSAELTVKDMDKIKHYAEMVQSDGR